MAILLRRLVWRCGTILHLMCPVTADFPLGSPESRAAVRAILLEEEANDAIWKACKQKEATFDSGCLLWLTQHTATEDQHWMSKGTQPIAPFPAKEYFAVVLKYLLECPKVFIPKTREMMTSWLVCGYVAWQMQWFPGMVWVLQSQKEDKAADLVNYVRMLYRLQDPWMKQRVKVVADNYTELKLSNGSKVTGIPQGADQWRSHHPHGAVFDEASHLTEVEACYNIVAPVARQIIAISSVAPGWFADQCGL